MFTIWHLIVLKNSCTCVTCERVRDCSAWRGLAIQYCINTSLVFAASFIWVSHSSPNVKLVLRAFILSNWTFNQSCINWHYFKMYVYSCILKYYIGNWEFWFLLQAAKRLLARTLQVPKLEFCLEDHSKISEKEIGVM